MVYIQTHIEERLSLAQMAHYVGLSQYHFHRLFRHHIGETLKQYTQRLRLERAAYDLKMREATILDVALSVGFQTHETFSRAFKKRFGLTPQQYRHTPDYPQRQDSDVPPREILNKYTDHYQLSKVQIRQLKAIPLAFIRYLGPYTEVDINGFEQLLTWAKTEGMYNGRNLLIGIGHDSPGITAPKQLRFDMCIEVPQPFMPEGAIGYQQLPAGDYGIATYIGPFGPTMYQAYNDILTQLMRHQGYDIVGLPAIEMYQTIHINQTYELQQTDILIPVTRQG